MKRYIAKPCGRQPDDDYDPGDRPTITVIEDEGEPVDTGLLDANGYRLFRVEEREPIGFRPRRSEPQE